jgi:hypothetical protein
MKIRKYVFLSVLILIFMSSFGQQKLNAQNDLVIRWLLHTHDKTNFPLTGRHRIVPCRDCHWNNVFEGTPSACEICHWNRRNDDRYSLRLGSHCGDCHTTFSWKNVPLHKWNHDVEAGYPLQGVHRALDCVECHGEKGFVREEVSCYSCHRDEYESSQNPGHLAAEFSVQCWLCHLNESSWQGALFSHDIFPLKQRHRLLECSDCHAGGIYKGLPSSCVSCHLHDYNNAGEPNHRQLGFPLECEICHGTSANSWENAIFTHNHFPLKGKHRTAGCFECHGSGIYEGLPSVCVYCHLDDWLYAENPNHKQLGFHTDCEACHGDNAISWVNSSYNHNSSWPLQGTHRLIDCIQCHHKGRNIPKDCASCHTKAYLAASNPNHKTEDFSLDCDRCHLPSHKTWNQAMFIHRFPIKSGRHAHLECFDCHPSANRRDFSCLNCHDHEKRQMDQKHRNISGYVYQSQACLACHFHGKR